MIVRSPRPDSHFTIIGNQVLRNQQLTLRARGLLALLLSYPDNWKTSSTNLTKVCPEGRDAIRKALTELEENGYLKRQKRQDEAGRWISESYVYDTPQKSTDFSTVPPQPTPEKPTPVNQALKENHIKKDCTKTSVKGLRVRTPRICGECSGTGWKPTGKSLSRCKCDGGIIR